MSRRVPGPETPLAGDSASARQRTWQEPHWLSGGGGRPEPPALDVRPRANEVCQMCGRLMLRVNYLRFGKKLLSNKNGVYVSM